MCLGKRNVLAGPLSLPNSVFLPERVSKFFGDVIELIPRERKGTGVNIISTFFAKLMKYHVKVGLIEDPPPQRKFSCRNSG